MMMEEGWIGKKVFVETNSGRHYTGKVIQESPDKIVIKDIKGMIVDIPKATSLIQEEG